MNLYLIKLKKGKIIDYAKIFKFNVIIHNHNFQ